MGILLDGNVDVELRQAFSETSQAETVAYRGWNGLSNGELLQRAQAEYDVLVTMDTNLCHQQNLRLFDVAVIVLRPESYDFEDLEALMPEVNRCLAELRPDQIVEIYPPERR